MKTRTACGQCAIWEPNGRVVRAESTSCICNNGLMLIRCVFRAALRGLHAEANCFLKLTVWWCAVWALGHRITLLPALRIRRQNTEEPPEEAVCEPEQFKTGERHHYFDLRSNPLFLGQCRNNQIYWLSSTASSHFNVSHKSNRKRLSRLHSRQTHQTVKSWGHVGITLHSHISVSMRVMMQCLQ